VNYLSKKKKGLIVLGLGALAVAKASAVAAVDLSGVATSALAEAAGATTQGVLMAAAPAGVWMAVKIIKRARNAG